LSRITAPTKGRVEVRGRLASLLEVGTGFHPELSGRENIFLNGAILGMTRRDIQKKFDEIVAFAEVEKFIDTPVKRYSSGMYVRLAFAVAANLDSDVLVIDEVLAVGDSVFREKCIGKMGDVSSNGRTVLFVSHDQSAVSKLCSRAVVLAEGANACDASVNEALAFYASSAVRVAGHTGVISGQLQDSVSIDRVTINEARFSQTTALHPGAPLIIDVFGEAKVELHEFRLTFCLRKDDLLVLGMHDDEAPGTQPRGRFISRIIVPERTLSPGRYQLDVYAYSHRSGTWLRAQSVAEFDIAVEWLPLYEPNHAMGIVNLPIAGTRVSQ
jgi:lipopolysaccharide transport system ATP-binding protein